VAVWTSAQLVDIRRIDHVRLRNATDRSPVGVDEDEGIDEIGITLELQAGRIDQERKARHQRRLVEHQPALGAVGEREDA